MRMGGVHAERAGLSVRVCRARREAIDWVVGGNYSPQWESDVRP
jgi:hypothetical protein